MKRLLIYTAGRFRGPTPWAVHQNVLKAEWAALVVIDLGAFPVIPHKIGEHFDGIGSQEFWLESTLELMRRCDAVFVYDDADLKISQGTIGEVAEAKRLGIPVLIGEESLEVWMVGRKYLPGD